MDLRVAGVRASTAGFDAFAATHGDLLVRLAYALTGDRGRAEDAAQDALERVFVRWGKLADPLPYARRCVVNATRDTWRRIGRRERPLPEGYDAAGPPAADLGARDELLRALRRLPHGQRSVVVLRFLHDLSEAETAATLGVTPGTVKSQTSRALRALRESLSEPEGAFL